MLLKLIRTYNADQTEGKLLIDGTFFCYTIEPPVGPRTGPIICPTANKVSGPVSYSGAQRNDPAAKRSGRSACCIPEGWYRIDITYSPRFQRLMPLLRMVPGFEGIRIHAGLSVQNTQGCICVGLRETEEQLTQLLMQAQDKHEEIYIHITNVVRERERRDDELCLS